MNDISDYIQGELIKTPFNLFNLITKYIESNNNIKVAFVGGYLRDLLISKFHKKSFSKPVDIDLVIEGSSISLAKFIKKNICLLYTSPSPRDISGSRMPSSA